MKKRIIRHSTLKPVVISMGKLPPPAPEPISDAQRMSGMVAGINDMADAALRSMRADPPTVIDPDVVNGPPLAIGADGDVIRASDIRVQRMPLNSISADHLSVPPPENRPWPQTPAPTDYRVPGLRERRGPLDAWREQAGSLVELCHEYRIDLSVVPINHLTVCATLTDLRMQRSIRIYLRMWHFDRIERAFRAATFTRPNSLILELQQQMIDTFPGTAEFEGGYL